MKSLGLLVLMSLVVGCAKDGLTDLPVYRSPRADNHAEFARTFKIVDRAGSAVLPAEPSGRDWPFGVLIVFLGDSRYTLCSATHLAYGKVVTNAHCVKEYEGASSHFLVFYDKAGRKTYARVSSIGYVGSSAATDFAVLNLTNADADRWDVAGSRIKDTSGSVDGRVPDSAFGVTIWSFDPGDNHGTGSETMVWNPNRCVASRTKPKAQGVRASGTKVTMTMTTNSNRDVFIDQCARETVKGNSGSLVTASADFGDKIAVFWGSYDWTSTNAADYDHLLYTGNTGVEARRFPAVGETIFNMATEFGYLRDNVRTGVF